MNPTDCGLRIPVAETPPFCESYRQWLPSLGHQQIFSVKLRP